LDRIDERQNILDGSFATTYGGAGVHVYIIDSGINNWHAEFANRTFGASWSAEGSAWTDCSLHGTHVASIAVGNAAGVARQATIHSVRINPDCNDYISLSDANAGIDWLLANHEHPAVANMSFSFPDFWDGGVQDGTWDLINHGVHVVAAAGNGGLVGPGDDACGFSPADVAGALTVAATNEDDERPGFSNYGSCVDLFAPGVNIRGAWGVGHALVSGTSQAAPFVTGVAALASQMTPSLTPGDLRRTIIQNATAGVVSNRGNGSPDLLLFADVTPAVSISIGVTGPDLAITPGNHHWDISGVSGGTGAFQYLWEIQYIQNGPPWYVALTGGPSLDLELNGCEGDFALRVRVTSGNATLYVDGPSLINLIDDSHCTDV
jgi:subtilisin family serine protease